MFIGVLSRTSGVNVEAVARALESVDYLLHVGGFGNEQILEELSHIAPLAGVRTKRDPSEEHGGVFETTGFREWGEAKIYLTTELKDPLQPDATTAAVIEEQDPSAILFHGDLEGQHRQINGRLFFSPGSASAARGRKAQVGILEVRGRAVRAEWLQLDA